MRSVGLMPNRANYRSLYYDSDKSSCACFADGIAIATHASSRPAHLVVAPEKARCGDAVGSI
jgi:hypothetical protein